MPHVIVKLQSGRSGQQKAKIAEAITQAIMTQANCAEQSVSVSIEDVEPQDWVKKESTSQTSSAIGRTSTKNPAMTHRNVTDRADAGNQHGIRKDTRHSHSSLTRRNEDAQAHAWQQRLEGLGHWLRLHGIELPPGRAARPQRDDRAPSQGGRTRRHIFRYRRSLRPLHQRKPGGRGARTLQGSRSHHDEVRLRPRPPVWRAEQPA